MLSTEKPIGNGALCARGADRPLNKQNRRDGRPAVWRLAIGARLAAQLAEVVNFHDTLPFSAPILNMKTVADIERLGRVRTHRLLPSSASRWKIGSRHLFAVGEAL